MSLTGPGTLLAGGAFTLSSGQCLDVWQAAQPTDPLSTITVSEVGLPNGVQFDSATVVEFDVPRPTSANPTVSVRGFYFHGSLLTYFNSATPRFEGCTPGYWKNHTRRWPAPYTPSSDFDATFGVNAFAPDITLLQALQLGGGGLNKLARHAGAALLTAAGGGNYPLSASQVISAVQAAINSGAYEPLATQLDAWNNLGCPFN